MIGTGQDWGQREHYGINEEIPRMIDILKGGGGVLDIDDSCMMLVETRVKFAHFAVENPMSARERWQVGGADDRGRMGSSVELR